MTIKSVQHLFGATVIALSLFASNMAEAQTFQAVRQHYTTKEGLCSNAVSNITTDDYGYIWISTWNGISRFDGFNFYNYQTGNASGIEGMHNRILQVIVDNTQNVWLRMYDGKIFAINRALDKIVNPFERIAGSADYTTSVPIAITSSGETLTYIDSIGLFKMRLDATGMHSQLVTTGGLKVTAIAEGYHDDIWVGTDHGMHSLNATNLSLDKNGVFEDEYINCICSNGYNIFLGTRSGKLLHYAYGQTPRLIKDIGEPITGIFLDSHDRLWFSTTAPGASKLDLTTGVVKHYAQHVPSPEFESAFAEFQENNGTVWIRMNKGGFGYYNAETDEVEYFHNDPANPWNLSNTVNAFLTMQDGVIWESTNRRGLEKMELLRKDILRTKAFPLSNEPRDNEIRALCYDKKRKILLIGNKNSSLLMIAKDGSQTVIQKDNNGKPFGRIYGISIDDQGDYWLATKDNGIFYLKHTSNGYDIVNFAHDNNNKYSLSSNKAYATAFDKDGHIWVATYDGGVNVLVKDKNGKYVAYHPNNVMRSYPRNSYMKVRTVARDREGRIWAGTTDGILIMSMRNNRIMIERVKNTKEQEHILRCIDIIFIMPGNNGEMWLGTNGGGLSRTIGKDKDGNYLFENFSSADGLPSEEIMGITLDTTGNIWFSTDNNICSFDPSRKVINTYSNIDGIDETLISEGAATAIPDGHILFGTINGYYVIDRKKLATNSGSLLRLRITDFFINDALQSPRFNDTYDYYVPDSKQVTLPEQKCTFSFRFASLNYQLQHRIHYQYMLEGYDSEWRNADHSRMATYENVPTGKYKFKVRAFLLESPDKADVKTITVIVPPHIMLSNYALWFYLILAAAAGIGIVYWREERIRKKIKKQKGNAPVQEEETEPSTIYSGEESDQLSDYEMMDENDNK